MWDIEFRQFSLTDVRVVAFALRLRAVVVDVFALLNLRCHRAATPATTDQSSECQLSFCLFWMIGSRKYCLDLVIQGFADQRFMRPQVAFALPAVDELVFA